MPEDTVIIGHQRPEDEDDRPSPALIVLEGPDVGRRYLLNEPSLVLGRSAVRADVVLGEETVSGRHCRIDTDLETGKATIEDLGSSNGTRLRNRKLTEVKALEDGDKVRLGNVLLKFVVLDAAEEKYLEAMDADTLTGLPLKRIFEQYLHDAFEQHPEERLCALMMDMDGLKKINDRHGHYMGASCIRQVGNLIAVVVGGKGKASRFGGDEFMGYLPDHTIEEAEQVGEEIRRAVESHEFRQEDVVVEPTISIGVAERTPEVKSPEKLLRLADAALYRAKQKGRNCVSR
ncbi:MAG: diguanylate cyclase [Planctomycetota bacterium]